MRNKFKKFNEGFTLIETFVAITILLVAVIGPMSLIAKFYSGSAYAKNQITASFLAQDGLETVQNIIRNNTEGRRNFLSDPSAEIPPTCAMVNGNSDQAISDWLYGLSGCVGQGKYCKVDTISNTSDACPGGTNCPLYRNANGFYTSKPSVGGTPVYWRDVNIIDLSTGDPNLREALVTARVGWSERGQPKTTVIQSVIIQNECP